MNEIIQAYPITPVIMNVLDVDTLRRRALEGDPKAVAILVRIAPATIPPEVAQAERDRLCRLTARWLTATLPSTSARCRAAILHAAFQRLTTGSRQLGPVPPFDVLLADERVELVDRCKTVLEWTEGSRGLGFRRLCDVCKDGR